MAIDPRIPLIQIPTLDLSTSINQLSQAFETRRQTKRFEQRQDVADVRAAETAESQGILTDLKISQIQDDIEAKGQAKNVRDYLSFLIRLTERTKIGDFVGAKALAVDQIGRLNELSKTEPGTNPDSIIELRQLLESDPVAAAKLAAAELSWATQVLGGDKRVKSGPRASAPVTLINPETKEKILVAPVVDPNTLEATLSIFDFPAGFEISTETAEEKRAADLIANIQELTDTLRTKFELEPELKGAISEAQATATAKVRLQEVKRVQKISFNTFQLGVDNLRKAFAETNTGFLVGRIPAITAKQQIAEGTVAIMAPLLKALFRESGEGIFTDRDQELLNDMAPKRTDEPEAVEYKINAIVMVVRAKLGIESETQSTDQTMQQDTLTPEEQAELDQLRATQQ